MSGCSSRGERRGCGVELLMVGLGRKSGRLWGWGDRARRGRRRWACGRAKAGLGEIACAWNLRGTAGEARISSPLRAARAGGTPECRLVVKLEENCTQQGIQHHIRLQS